MSDSNSWTDLFAYLGGHSQVEVIHYLFFFNTGDAGFTQAYESKIAPGCVKDEKAEEMVRNRLDEIKADVSRNGLNITQNLNAKVFSTRKTELHIRIPSNTEREEEPRKRGYWAQKQIVYILAEQGLKSDFSNDDEWNKLVYTVSAYGGIVAELGAWGQKDDVIVSFYIQPTGDSDSCVVFSKVARDKNDVSGPDIWPYYMNRYHRYKNEILREANTRTAIGTIMSRNGSHNIGSHVLSSLSHFVGTTTEDRKLYQYIQQRMDYIATATAEIPKWKQSAMLIGNVLNNFLSQRRLLEYIGASEGLGYYDEEGGDDQYGKIRIHKPKEDVEVAIPGGVVGFHAFYTILENIIRNAAKHQWSCISAKEKKEKNLEVHIEVEDNKGGDVNVKIWCGGEITGDQLKVIRDSLEAKLIDEAGRPIRKSWGLAEMRVSAGFLFGVGELNKISASIENGCLVYTFSLMKPENGNPADEIKELIPIGEKTLSIYLGDGDSGYGLFTEEDIKEWVIRNNFKAIVDEFLKTLGDQSILRRIIKDKQLPDRISCSAMQWFESCVNDHIRNDWNNRKCKAIRALIDWVQLRDEVASLFKDDGKACGALGLKSVSSPWPENLKIELLEKLPSDEKSYQDEHMIRYWRHADTRKNYTDTKGYLEGLSGSQSYFNALASELDKKETLIKFVRAGIWKIRIFDERVYNFMNEHDGMKNVYDRLLIAVGGEAEFDKAIDSELKFDEDIVIVHQGLIEKYLNKHPECSTIYETLKEKAKRFVVCTGRGASKIEGHDDIGVMPFPTIGSTLMTGCPEKMILVDALYQITKEKTTQIAGGGGR